MNSPGQESRPNFTTQNVRKHRKLISPRVYIIIHILSPAFFHPYFINRIFPSAILQPPSQPSGPHFTETPLCRMSSFVRFYALEWRKFALHQPRLGEDLL